jgi:hypothetical protein
MFFFQSRYLEHRIFHSSIIDTIILNLWRVAGRLCVTSFGLKMMYPGVFLQSMIGRVLHEGRAKYIEQKRGQRAVVQTNDTYRNKIDTMFVDKRNVVSYSSRVATLDSNSDPAANGKYLVICCDGNASFYEIGLLNVPTENGFSVLGWNYPGFGQSTVNIYIHSSLHSIKLYKIENTFRVSHTRSS